MNRKTMNIQSERKTYATQNESTTFLLYPACVSFAPQLQVVVCSQQPHLHLSGWITGNWATPFIRANNGVSDLWLSRCFYLLCSRASLARVWCQGSPADSQLGCHGRTLPAVEEYLSQKSLYVPGSCQGKRRYGHVNYMVTIMTAFVNSVRVFFPLRATGVGVRVLYGLSRKPFTIQEIQQVRAKSFVITDYTPVRACTIGPDAQPVSTWTLVEFHL